MSVYNLNKRSKKITDDLQKLIDIKKVQHISFGEDYNISVLGNPKKYRPNPTAVKVHSSKDRVKLVMGPFGSGKSVMCIHDIVIAAAVEMLPNVNDGIRRSRWAIVRNTIGRLESTTIPTWLDWFSHLPLIKRNKRPVTMYTYRFNDGKGLVEIELIFLGLDREDQRSALESLEVTGSYFNEFQHLPQKIFSHMIGRIERYPNRNDVMSCKVKIIMNNPDITIDYAENIITETVIAHKINNNLEYKIVFIEIEKSNLYLIIDARNLYYVKSYIICDKDHPEFTNKNLIKINLDFSELEIEDLYFDSFIDIEALKDGDMKKAFALFLKKGMHYYSFIVSDTNPPDTDHWIYKYFEINPPSSSVIFKQPPGLIKDSNNNWKDNPKADNIRNLADDYYYNMGRQNKFQEEYIKVYCRGEWGIVVKGKHVFPEYNDDLHCVNDLDVLQGETIYLCWDFGLTPACLIMQFRDDGQLRCLKEFTTDRMFIRELVKDIVKPFIDKHFSGFGVTSVGDPSGDAGGGSSEAAVSAMEILREEGITTNQAKTNNILPRLEAVKYYLNRLIAGDPAFLISKTGCPVLRKSLNGYYFYKRVRVIGEDSYRDTPNKNHPFSDISDCLQYGALEGYACDKSRNIVNNVDNYYESNSVWI